MLIAGKRAESWNGKPGPSINADMTRRPTITPFCHREGQQETYGANRSERVMGGSNINIGSTPVGNGEQCFIIAEAGVNHNGSLDMAKSLVDAAAAAGADAVKFQTFRTEHVVTRSAEKAAYQKETTGSGESQFDMIRRLELSFDDFRDLCRHARSRGITFLSTPDDRVCADFLLSLGVPAFKISSGEVTNFPLLSHIGALGRPVILSTGMSDLGEVERALAVLRAAGAEELILLHCVTSYPAEAADANLKAMETLRCAFQVPVGYSDHTLGIRIPLAAVAMGACIIEKHFTLDRSLPGPDHRASLSPPELKEMVAGIREIERAMGSGRKIPSAGECEIRRVARRSIVAALKIPRGSLIEAGMLELKRPGTGLPPALLPRLMGKQVKRTIQADELIRWDDITW